MSRDDSFLLFFYLCIIELLQRVHVIINSILYVKNLAHVYAEYYYNTTGRKGLVAVHARIS